MPTLVTYWALKDEGREHGLEEAARSVSREVADISDDLDLASILLESAGTREVVGRSL